MNHNAIENCRQQLLRSFKIIDSLINNPNPIEFVYYLNKKARLYHLY